MEACHLRFRPILMTSLAFTLGVAAAGDRHGRERGQPERHRHRRDGRHDRGDGAGDLLRAGVLRVRHEDHRPQGKRQGGQRTGAQPVARARRVGQGRRSALPERSSGRAFSLQADGDGMRQVGSVMARQRDDPVAETVEQAS